MSNYNGARYFKCDLHMHSPMDSSWREKSTKLHIDDPSEKKKRIAKQYLCRCHEVGLEVIAITDHNFAKTPEHSFLNYLWEENEIVANELDRSPLTIFGGFEIEADIGKGNHVIGIFPQKIPLNIIESRVVECGLKPESRFDAAGNPEQSTKNLTDILGVVQNSKQYKGIVTCPHPFNKKGLLCDDNMEMWLQQKEFTNLNLYCIEIPKNIMDLNENLRKLIIGGDDCLEEWKRTRPIGYIMSSDCYYLNQNEQENSNYIGYRYTWIKMSNPSIESLRQAFLDRDSRIKFGEKSPDELYTYPKIKKVKINGASFYDANPVSFSPNLNCIIGSRGSGKSTLVDYIRLALDRLREDDLPSILKEEIEKRINDTLDKNSNILIEIEKEGIPYKIEYFHGHSTKRVITNLKTGEANSDWDVRTLFNIRILSQREIDKIVDGKTNFLLRKLLDDFIKDELKNIKEKAQDKINEIDSIDVDINSLKEKQKDRSSLETKKAQLEATIDTLEELKEPLRKWEEITNEKEILENLFNNCENIKQGLAEHIRESDININDNIKDLNTQNEELIKSIHRNSNFAISLLYNSINNSLKEFSNRLNKIKEKYEKEWLPIYSNEKTQFNDIKEELKVKGYDPTKFLEYKTELNEVTNKLDKLDKERKKIEKLEGDRSKLIEELNKIWEEETKLRLDKAKEIMDNLKLENNQKSLIEIKVKHQDNIQTLIKDMENQIEDKRRINKSDIEDIINKLKNDGYMGLELRNKFFEESRKREKSVIIKEVLGENRHQAFLETFTETALKKYDIFRIPDTVEYFVYRQDGSLAGSIDKISVGQKGLAFLNLILASGNDPLIVDTPEEGLDNEGVYFELVPIFRREKEKRQISVVTHNANIPVIADGENIITLEAVGFVPFDDLQTWINNLGYELNEDQIKHLIKLIEQKDWEKKLLKYLTEKQNWEKDDYVNLKKKIGPQRQAKGRLRKRNESVKKPIQICVGGLDKKPVIESIKDIMEGSEEAFTRRREKYGF